MRRPTPAAEFVEIERKTGGLSRTIVIVFLSFRAGGLALLVLAENWQDIF
jgi:hypothetical protein